MDDVSGRQSRGRRAVVLRSCAAGTHVASAAASEGTRKLPGGALRAGVASTMLTEPTPASTMFLHSCARGELAAQRGAGRRRQRRAFPPRASAATPVQFSTSTRADVSLPCGEKRRA